MRGWVFKQNGGRVGLGPPPPSGGELGGGGRRSASCGTAASPNCWAWSGATTPPWPAAGRPRPGGVWPRAGPRPPSRVSRSGAAVHLNPREGWVLGGGWVFPKSGLAREEVPTPQGSPSESMFGSAWQRWGMCWAVGPTTQHSQLFSPAQPPAKEYFKSVSAVLAQIDPVGFSGGKTPKAFLGFICFTQSRLVY